MGIRAFFMRRRSGPELRGGDGVQVRQSDPEILRIFGLDPDAAGEEIVTIESALGVPAIWAAVNFLAGTVAGLPLKVYRATDDGPQVQSRHPLTAILNGVANDEDMQSAFDLRKWMIEQVLTGGRGMIFIDRNARHEVINLWPMDPRSVTIRRQDRRKRYEVTGSDGRTTIYAAQDVIDVPFMLREDGLQHRSPITSNRAVVALAQSVTKWGLRFFANGGVPPFAITGKFRSGGAMTRAADDLDDAVRKAARERRQALVLPEGLEIQPLGSSADDAQMIETQRLMIEQIARIYSLPPVFLQDLTHGTFSNTEQQDLHLVKHTVKRWVEQIEQEMTLKFFGRGSEFHVEHSLDGLLRGDFKTRMEGYARAIQSGVMMPNEARGLENRPAGEGGDRLMIQGATVPLIMAGKVQVGRVPGNPAGGKGDDE